MAPDGPFNACSLPQGHEGQHEAWEGHQVGPVGGCLSAWSQETKTGPANVTTFSELRDLVIELEARETETRLRHAERLDVFEDRLQRLRDDTRDAAAEAGEALERTKGLQVPEILRRLSQTERRINLMDGGRVARETATDDRLLNAVTELTTVMRELVKQNTPSELCNKRVPFTQDVFCDRQKGHDGPHHPMITVTVVPEPRTCPVGVRFDTTQYKCTLPLGHIGVHESGPDDTWDVTNV
jgi:hypothetical protein